MNWVRLITFCNFHRNFESEWFYSQLTGQYRRDWILAAIASRGCQVPALLTTDTKPLKISTNILLRFNGCPKPPTLRDSHVTCTQVVITLWRKVSFQNGRPGRGTRHLWLERELNTRSRCSLIIAFVSRIVWPPEITAISPEIKTCLRKYHCGLPSLLPWSYAPFPLVDGQSYT